MNPASRLLLIFVKHPVPGKVKTRLGATIGHENAVLVYQDLLSYTCRQVKNLLADKQVWYGNEIPDQDLWSQAGYERLMQTGEDLGARMALAFAEGFAAGYEKILIIGSDCAALTTEHLEQAYAALDTHDAVIGPARDGGYYLLGLKALLPALFENKTWSTASVRPDTLADFAAANKSVHQLEMLSDIDTEADLKGTFLAKHLSE